MSGKTTARKMKQPWNPKEKNITEVYAMVMVFDHRCRPSRALTFAYILHGKHGAPASCDIRPMFFTLSAKMLIHRHRRDTLYIALLSTDMHWTNKQSCRKSNWSIRSNRQCVVNVTSRVLVYLCLRYGVCLLIMLPVNANESSVQCCLHNH